MRIPFSTPPTRPTNWWKSVPGQLSIIAIGVGVLMIVLALFGVIDAPCANGIC